MAIAVSASDRVKLESRIEVLLQDIDNLRGDLDLGLLLERMATDRVAEVNAAAGTSFCTAGDDLPDTVFTMLVDGVVFYLLAGGYLKVKNDEQARVELWQGLWQGHLQRLSDGLLLPDTTEDDAAIPDPVTSTEARTMFTDDTAAVAAGATDAANLRRLF